MSDNRSGRGPRSLTPREKRYWGGAAIACLVGAAAFVFLKAVQPQGSKSSDFADLLANAQMSASTAIMASLAFFGIMAVSLYLQHRGMDEQEERAYLIACTASWYVIVAAVPIWWLLSRAALAPPVQYHQILLASVVINGAVWAWKKFV